MRCFIPHELISFLFSFFFVHLLEFDSIAISFLFLFTYSMSDKTEHRKPTNARGKISVHNEKKYEIRMREHPMQMDLMTEIIHPKNSKRNCVTIQLN